MLSTGGLGRSPDGGLFRVSDRHDICLLSCGQMLRISCPQNRGKLLTAALNYGSEQLLLRTATALGQRFAVFVQGLQ